LRQVIADHLAQGRMVFEQQHPHPSRHAAAKLIER
jgi:hypothetical protein